MDLAQQIYLSQLRQPNVPHGTLPLQQMPQFQPQASQNPLSTGSMEAINAVRRSLGMGPGDKQHGIAGTDILHLIGALLGTQSKVPWVQQFSAHNLANFDPHKRERERIAQNMQIMDYLSHQEKARQHNLHQQAVLNENIRAHNLKHEIAKLTREEGMAYRTGEAMARREEREDIRKWRDAENEARRQERHLERTERESSAEKEAIKEANKKIKGSKNSAELNKSATEYLKYFEDYGLINYHRLSPQVRQRMNALKKDIFAHVMNRLPAGTARSVTAQKLVENAIPGVGTTSTAARTYLERLIEETNQDVENANEAREYLASLKRGKELPRYEHKEKPETMQSSSASDVTTIQGPDGKKIIGPKMSQAELASIPEGYRVIE